jgi:hypothetical protein
VESTSGGNYQRINPFASEVARHQLVRKSADLKFNSRRLHQKMPELCSGFFAEAAKFCRVSKTFGLA